MPSESPEGFGDRVQRKGFLFHATASCSVLLLLAGFTLFGMKRISFWELILWLILTVPASYSLARIVWIGIDSFGNGLIHLLMSDGGTPQPNDFSEQQALVVQWKYDEAIASYRRYIDDHPGEIEARLRLGALLADQVRDHAAAEECFLEARILGGSLQQEATLDNALIDLYAAAGNTERLRAELGRFSRRYAGSGAAVHARARLRQMTNEAAEPS